MSDELCHCGQPLHYTDKEIEATMNKMVAEKGRYIAVTSHIDMRTYKVDRHYIALHGLKGAEVPTSGFEIINGSEIIE